MHDSDSRWAIFNEWANVMAGTAEYKRQHYLDNKESYHARVAAWRTANFDQVARTKRNARLKRVYGITAVEYDQILERQGFCCAICRSDSNEEGWSFAVDHCHDSFIIRGLLCNRCNRGLGLFKDDPDILRLAITYLEQNNG